MAKYHYYCPDLDHDKSPDDCPGDYDIDYLTRDHDNACTDDDCDSDHHVTVLFDHEYHDHTLDIITTFLNTASSHLLYAAARTAEDRERVVASGAGLDLGALGGFGSAGGTS